VEALEDSFTAPRLRTPLHVYWARETLDAGGQPPIDWSPHTDGPVTVRVFEGDHGSIIRNPDLALAVHQAMTAYIARPRA
jgi:surfactin synthase thioesterase subunit